MAIRFGSKLLLPSWMGRTISYRHSVLDVTAKRKLKFITSTNPPFLKQNPQGLLKRSGIVSTLWSWHGFGKAWNCPFLLTLCFIQWWRQSGILFVLHTLWRISPLESEVYEKVFSLQQGDKYIVEYYNQFRSMIDELNQYQPRYWSRDY